MYIEFDRTTAYLTVNVVCWSINPQISKGRWEECVSRCETGEISHAQVTRFINICGLNGEIEIIQSSSGCIPIIQCWRRNIKCFLRVCLSYIVWAISCALEIIRVRIILWMRCLELHAHVCIPFRVRLHLKFNVYRVHIVGWSAKWRCRNCCLVIESISCNWSFGCCWNPDFSGCWRDESR